MICSRGKIVGAKGTLLQATLPFCRIGDLCKISLRGGNSIFAEVVSYSSQEVFLSPHGDIMSVGNGDIVETMGEASWFSVPFDQSSHSIPKGAVLDVFGTVVNKPPDAIYQEKAIPLRNLPPSPLSRPTIREIFETKIASIDAFCTLGVGQRIGLFASAGSGKSTLLSMLARNSSCDAIVIALVGERGREVNEFLEILGKEGQGKSILVIATSDESPLKRIRAAEGATAIAEHLREMGSKVLLLIDSLTRYARAARDIALCCGELPIRQGFPPSVYLSLPKLIERAGNSSNGSITAIYTVLTNEETVEDPLADEVKSLLDGHLYLSPALAERGIRPAIDINRSLSRLNGHINKSDVIEAQIKVRKCLHLLEQKKDLLLFGAVADEALQEALTNERSFYELICQKTEEARPLDQSHRTLISIASKLKN